jgi:hypothetical protein
MASNPFACDDHQTGVKLPRTRASQMRSWLVGIYVFIAFGFLGVIAKDLLFK